MNLKNTQAESEPQKPGSYTVQFHHMKQTNKNHSDFISLLGLPYKYYGPGGLNNRNLFSHDSRN